MAILRPSNAAGAPVAKAAFGVLSSQLRRNLIELVVFAAIFSVLFAVLLAVDAFDALHTYTRTHEDWELDEFLVAVLALGVTGFGFTFRRWKIQHDNLKEIQTLKADVERALEKAEASDRAKSSFLANLSHELRTPLNAVIGYAQVMEASMIGPISSRYAGYASDIRESGEHLLDVINDILDITRADAAKMELRPDAIDLHRLTATCFKLVGARAMGAGIALDNAVPEALPLMIADPQRLKQILINLVGNAVKFSPTGARVSVTAHWSGEAVVIEVRDQGIGMTAEDAERVLQPFVQVESTLSRKYDGVGLGLPLVQRLTSLHGGSFELDTALGEGTTAIVTLPQPQPAAHDGPVHGIWQDARVAGQGGR